MSVAVNVIFPPAAVTFTFCRISLGDRAGAMLAASANAFVNDSRWQVIFMEMQTGPVEVL